MHTKIDPTSLEWFHQPSLYIQNAEKLIIETEPYSRMDDFHQEEGLAFGVYGPWETNFEIKMRMEYKMKTPGDECGLIVKLNDDRWVKFGVVLKNKEIAEVFCTRYSRGLHDRSVREIGSGIVGLYLKVSYDNGRASFSYSMNDRRYTDFRVMEFPDDGTGGRFGMYACSPENSYFDVTYSHIESLKNKE